MIEESCATCARQFKAKKSGYSHDGCEVSNLDGFICLCCAEESIAEWMIGTSLNGLCEMYLPKGEYRLIWTKNTSKT